MPFSLFPSVLLFQVVPPPYYILFHLLEILPLVRLRKRDIPPRHISFNSIVITLSLLIRQKWKRFYEWLLCHIVRGNISHGRINWNQITLNVRGIAEGHRDRRGENDLSRWSIDRSIKNIKPSGHPFFPLLTRPLLEGRQRQGKGRKGEDSFPEDLDRHVDRINRFVLDYLPIRNNGITPTCLFEEKEVFRTVSADQPAIRTHCNCSSA